MRCLPFSGRAASARRIEHYRPQVLALEDRLPPGDALLGALLMPGLLGPELAAIVQPVGQAASLSGPVAQAASLSPVEKGQRARMCHAFGQAGSLSYEPASAGRLGDGSYSDITNAAGSAPLHSYPQAGLLAVPSAAPVAALREGVAAGGFQEQALVSRTPSSDAAQLDAIAHGLAAIKLQSGGGRAALVLGTQTVAGNLSIYADGPVVVQGTIRATGTLTIVAPSVSIQGGLHASAVRLASSGLVNLDAGADVSAGRVDLAGRVVVNAGAIHADGPVGGTVAIHAGNILNGGQVTADGLAGAGGTVAVTFSGTYLDTAAARTTADGDQGGQVTLDGGATSRLFSSGSQEARGLTGDGAVILHSPAIVAAGAVGFSLLDAPLPVERIRNPSKDAHSPHGGDFGWSTTPLANGNVVVTNPHDDFVALDSGAAYLINGQTGALMGALLGSTAGDQVGGGDETGGSEDGPGAQSRVSSGGVIALSNGNYVVASPHWRKDRGAVTWGNGTVGTTGIVNHHNSLVGSNPADQVGVRVTALTNGNYVVRSPCWTNAGHCDPTSNPNGLGAATWGDGTVGITGTINARNSLIGSAPGDAVSFGGVIALSNGNYVVASPHWSGRGAATWGDGTVGVIGTIDTGNSLVGSSAGDAVGASVTALSNGNYVVASPSWNGSLGAATWGDGTVGVTGTINAGNSLIGSSTGDTVGSAGVTALSNGNYVVGSPAWHAGYGAATWGDGTFGVTGTIDAGNSLVGSNPGDEVAYGVTALANGNYVVRSPFWGGTHGAATWGDGSAGTTGTIDATNSLVGSDPLDAISSLGVTSLSNGNYVVVSPSWHGGHPNGFGAATWGDGNIGVDGMVNAGNSLVGNATGDRVAFSGVAALSNGNYVVESPFWSGTRGAATWGDGSAGITGTIDATNSLVGSGTNDQVGYAVTALSNGNYVVVSPSWRSERGAATWGDGSAGSTGAIDATNSLIGSSSGDTVDSGGVTALSNGNYVVASPNWQGGPLNGFGAATWGDGSAGITGTIDATNSLIGSSAQDQVGGGSFGGVIALTNGNYVVHSPDWKGGPTNGVGAATWGDGTLGVAGMIDDTNSLIGRDAADHVGGGSLGGGGGGGVMALANGNYVVASPLWNSRRGAATWGDGAVGTTGTVDTTNSLVG